MANVASEGKSLYQQGEEAWNNGDYGNAVAFFEQAAKRKYANAWLALGKAYYFGQGVQQDYEKAYLLLQRAREKSKSRVKTAEALYYLAQLFRNGLGIGKSSMRAYNRLKLSAQLKNNDAMYMLGEMHENGECEWNTSRTFRAETWYRDAAFAGNIQAMRRLVRIYKYGECDVEKDENKATYWLERVKEAERNIAKKSLR